MSEGGFLAVYGIVYVLCMVYGFVYWYVLLCTVDGQTIFLMKGIVAML